jgi:PAS domain S-box-containing protein
MIPLGAATGLSKAEALERARRGEFKIWRCDMRIQTRDGETRWVTDAAVEICDDAGVQRSSIGILQDITERKRAEEILRHNEDQYRDLVEASPMIIVLHDLDGTILSANPAAVQLFGGTTAEFTHLNVQDILAPRVRDQFERYLTTVQQNGYASGLMLVQTRADEERLLEYTSTLRTEGVSTPIVRAMARDVTELKRAERAQTRLAKQMAALYATSLEINAQMDLAQLLPTIVRRAADLVGASSGALYLLQPDNQTLKLFASHNMRGDYAGATLRLGEGLAGRVAQTGCPVMVEDHSQWEERAALFADAPFRQVLGVPLKSGNRVIGVLNVVDIEKAGAYQEEEIRLVSLLADQAAIAIENARLLAETQARADEFTALYETARDLMTQNDLNTLLRTIVTRATTLLKSKTGSIFLYDAERGDLELVVAQSDQIASRARLKLGEGMAGRVALSRQPLIVDNYSTWEHRLPEYNQIFFTAALQVPMIYGGELIGVLDVSEVGTFTRKFSETDARLLSLFAAQAASAVYNTRLLQQTRQRAEQLALLYDAVLTINRALEPHQIIEHLMQLIRQSVRAERADLFGYDPIQHTLIFEDGSGSSAELESLLRSLKFTEGNVHGLVGLVAQDRTPLYLPNVTVDSRWIPIDATIRSALWMPVEREKQLYGVLMITSPHLNAFAPADQRLVALFANQVAVTLERAHLSQTEQNRRAELTALYDLSRALADTDSRDAILKLVVRFAVETLRVTFARLALLERDTLIVEAVQPIRLLEHNLGIGSRNTETHLPGCQRALDQNQIMLLDATDPQISAPERDFLLLDLAKTLALVPLRSGGQTLGLLMLGEMRHPERKPFAVEQMRLARNIGDQAASALRRTKLREQIEHRLSQLQALHTIDLTINASLDLSVTLEVLLTQVTDQAGAAAADILAFNPQTQMLTYLAGRGFRSKGIETAQLRLGKEYAGRAALECRIVSEPDLPARRESLLRGFLHSVEGFVSCVCVPLIAKGQVKGVLEIFYRTPFQPDSEWLELVETLGTQAAIAIDNAELFDRLQRSNLELALAHDATIAGWSRALELRDPAPAGRTLRVTALTLRLARALGMREPELIHLRHGALLHDVGALSIPDTLWRKRGALTPEETQIVQEHPSQAHAILSSIPYLRPILDIPYCHHERWDGQGYPRGLAGEQIPLAARIFAVADAWDALTAEQPGQPAQTPNQARAYLQEMAGKIFDPRVVKAFLPLAEEIHNEQK